MAKYGDLVLLAVQAGYDVRIPCRPAIFQGPLEKDFKGARIAWAGDFNGNLPYEPGVLELCKNALKTFEAMGCVIEEAQPDYSIDAVWRAWLKLRAWQNGGTLLPYYNDPAKRALLKPEAVFEVESGLKLSAFDITAASLVRTEWYQAVRRFFEKYDFLIAPTAQTFPFDADMHWPKEIAGRKMETYHEWMKGVLPITMSDVRRWPRPPASATGAADRHPDRCAQSRRAVLSQLAHAYDAATNWAQATSAAAQAIVRTSLRLDAGGADHLGPFSVSARITAPTRRECRGAGPPTSAIRVLTSGSSSAALITRLRIVTMPPGVPRAPMPDQVLTSKPGSVSPNVGTSGSAAVRIAGSTASARTAPLRICGSEFGMASIPAWMRPPACR